MTTIGKGCRAISLIKGIEFNEQGPILISDMIKDAMNGMDVSVLMGANVANEVARDDFCESTVGYKNKENGACWQRLFDCPTFRIGSINDVAGVEICGALKNVVALGAGFCDGLGMGGNTKAAIIRIGLKETIKFAKMFFSGVQDDTFFESCGLADLVTTCFGGRNRKCAEAFAKKEGTWDEIETELLNGQKLQGTICAKDVMVVLKAKKLVSDATPPPSHRRAAAPSPQPLPSLRVLLILTSRPLAHHACFGRSTNSRSSRESTRSPSRARTPRPSSSYREWSATALRADGGAAGRIRAAHGLPSTVG